MEPESGTASIVMSVEWPFDQGNDEKDTIWGNKAYAYYEKLKGEGAEVIDSITILLELRATQVND